MEICRFPVVQKPLERVPLPPRARSNSTSRTLPSLDGADGCCVEMKDVVVKTFAPVPTPLATKVVASKAHRNLKMATTPTTILPSPSSPGSYMPLPLPSIVPLAHQPNPFLVCPPHLAGASSPSLPSPSSSPSSSTSSTPGRQSAPFFVPISLVNGGASGSSALIDPHLLHGHQLSRSASTSPVPGPTGDQAKKSDSKKRPRSASTPSGSNSGESSAARSKRKRKSPEQLALLEKEFETNPMPNKDVREHLSQHLGLTSRQVQIWFQNKRAKVKNNRVGGSQSPQEASSPEGSPSMNSPPTDSPCSSTASTPLSLSTASSALASSYPAPSSPSASFQQFSAIDSFFEPSYFDLLLDAPSYGPSDFLLQQQTTA